MDAELVWRSQVVADLEGEPFLPIPTEDLLVNLSDARAVVDSLLDSLPSIVAPNNSPDSALGAALQVYIMSFSISPPDFTCFRPGGRKRQLDPCAELRGNETCG
jgi:hypothetical protein